MPWGTGAGIEGAMSAWAAPVGVYELCLKLDRYRSSFGTY